MNSPRLGVIYNKKLQPLFEAIGAIESNDLTHALVGHRLEYDAQDDDILVIPNENYDDGIFIPDESAGLGAGSLGIYANDLAYDSSKTTNKVLYDEAGHKNILQLVWRLDLVRGQLAPTWPVVITKDDITFNNKDFPLEVGIQYSWTYWEAVRAKQLL